MGDAIEVDKRQRCGGGFVESVKAIAAAHRDDEVVVLVTHREGIWQLHRHVGTRGQNGYCNTSYYNYDLSSKALTSWDPISRRTAAPTQQKQSSNIGPESSVVQPHAKRNTTPNRCTFAPTQCDAMQATTQQASNHDTLESLLTNGSGTVKIHRGGNSKFSTFLWRTPGVRGVWAEGGAFLMENLFRF